MAQIPDHFFEVDFIMFHTYIQSCDLQSEMQQEEAGLQELKHLPT